MKRESKQKELTLNQVWARCLAMWRWIVSMKESNPSLEVSTLKARWLRDHDPNRALLADCYFCQRNRYDLKGQYRDTGTCCSECPGRLMDRRFHCSVKSYSYRYNPAAFLRKLEQLNTKRLNRKAKK